MTYAVRTAFATEPGGRQWRAYAYHKQEEASAGDGFLTPEELEIWKGIVTNFDAAPHLGASALTGAETYAGQVVLEGTIVSGAGSPGPHDTPRPEFEQPGTGRLRRQPGTNLSSDLVTLALGSRAPDPGRMTPAQEVFLQGVLAGLPDA